MRKVKCRVCSTLNDINLAYKYVHTTSGGKDVNMYYCSEDEFLKDKEEKEYRAKFEEKFSDIMNYTVINSNVKRLYNEIQKSGYSNKEIYSCLVEKERDIIRALDYKKSIKEERWGNNFFNKIKRSIAVCRKLTGTRKKKRERW